MLSNIESLVNGRPATENVPTTVLALAASLRVIHVPELQVFSVGGDDGQTHSVKLFPRESCTCPASTTCCHILAARKSVGLDTDSHQRKTMNLSKLRRNSR